MNDDVFQLSGTMIDQKYRVGAVVARGGFGVVYRGEQVRLKRPVAIKVLSWTGDTSVSAEEIAEQFVAEAELLARLDHPAIVRVLDVGSVTTSGKRDAPWMALEWVEGRTLYDDIASRTAEERRAPAECLALMRPVLEALALAHSHGIAHRDIKPGNIMLVTPPSDAALSRGRALVRLLDFGIAKVMAPDEARPTTGETATTSKLSAFSARYASPEQVSGSRTGPWTDVHAVALVITHLLTMRAPYPGEDALSIAARALSIDRPTPGSFGVDVGAWEPVLAKALALHPSDRYPDAGALLAALDASVPASVSPPRRDSLLHTAPPEVSLSDEPSAVAPSRDSKIDRAVAPKDAHDPLENSLKSEERSVSRGASRRARTPLALAALALVACLALALSRLRRADAQRETALPLRSADASAPSVVDVTELDASAAPADATAAIDAVEASAADVTDAARRDHAVSTNTARAHRDAGPRQTTVPPIPLGP